MSPRPRVFVDIKTRKINHLSKIRKMVNLSFTKKSNISLACIARGFSLVAALAYLLFGSVIAPVYYRETLAAQNTSEDRATLEKQLLDLENQISTYESTVSSYKKQGKSLQTEIQRLDTKIRQLNLQIKAIELTLQNLDKEIVENKTKIGVTENNLEFNKRALAESLQNIYLKENDGFVEILLKNPQFSNFLADVNSLLILQESLQKTVRKIATLREELLDAKEELALKKTDAETLHKYQDSQKSVIQNVKQEKSQLLAATKGQESKYQELLKETKKTAAQIRAQIFEFLGGGELSFEEAYKLARAAEGATKVPAAMILAVLDRESALGQNVGRCNYKTAMNPRRDAPIFLALVSSLGINPKTITVSCANSDGAYGGAMGPAQFIPSTWDLYAARVSELTGNHPASPWRNSDAFMAAALYLKDAGVQKGISVSELRRAAARYYAGARWQRYLWTYGEKVVVKAKEFEQDIEVLNG